MGQMGTSAAGSASADRQGGWALRLGRATACDCAPWSNPMPKVKPVLTARAEPARRRSLWEIGESLHCSVIGTCLSTDELRRLMRKLAQGEPDATDHRLHGLAAGLCGRQGRAAKLIQKALDERHRPAIRRFEAATNVQALRALWSAALAAGEVPGAYWALLTHPAADQPLIIDAFGDVHMLSHLVGAANRADIRRLAEQDREITTLRATVDRQQQRLRDDITERDNRICALQDLVTEGARRNAETLPAASETDRLIAELQCRVARLAARAEAVEARRADAERRLDDARLREHTLETECQALRREVAAAEAVLDGTGAALPAIGASRLVLYVGGRSGQTAMLRQAAARAGAELLHHDAEQGSALLAGLVGRAALVVFPVDCVSHDAALAVKRLCRQAGRPFRPLRSTGAKSLLAALRDPGPEAAAAE